MIEDMVVARETTELRQLHSKIRTVWRFSSLLTGVITGIGGAGVGALVFKIIDSRPAVGAGLGFLVCFLLFGILSLTLIDRQFDQWRYQLREHDILIKKGLFWRSERYIARDRVQHIDINAGPIDRKFGLVQVVIYAAGISGSVGLIPGLNPDEANWLKDQLLSTRAEDA